MRHWQIEEFLRQTGKAENTQRAYRGQLGFYRKNGKVGKLNSVQLQTKWLTNPYSRGITFCQKSSSQGESVSQMKFIEELFGISA